MTEPAAALDEEPMVRFGDPEPDLPTAAGLPVVPPVAAGNSQAAPPAPYDDYASGPLELSDLAELRDEVTEQITRKPLRVRVPERRGNWLLELAVELDDKTFARFQRLADRKGNKRTRGEAVDLSDVSEARLSALLLGHYCIGIYRGGRAVLDGDGDKMTFKSREWHELVGVNPGDPTPAATAAVKMYGGDDGLLVQAGRALMRKSGWLDTAAEVDDEDDELLLGEVGPTGRS